MKKQITHLSVHQVSKVIGFVHFLFVGIFCFPFAILLYLVSHQIEFLGLLVTPFIAWLFTYVGMAVICGLYNFAARSVGGIEYYTTEVD